MNWIYFISDYIHVPSKKFRKQLFTAAMTCGDFLLAIFLNAWQVFSSRPMADLTWSDVDFDFGLYIRPATTWFIASCGHKAAPRQGHLPQPVASVALAFLFGGFWLALASASASAWFGLALRWFRLIVYAAASWLAIYSIDVHKLIIIRSKVRASR